MFPWGSLLRAVAVGEFHILANIKRICAVDATLRIVFTLDKNTDQSEIQRLAIPELSMQYINSILVEQYKSAGFDIQCARLISFSELRNLSTTWAKKLQQNKDRSVCLLEAIAR